MVMFFTSADCTHECHRGMVKTVATTAWLALSPAILTATQDHFTSYYTSFFHFVVAAYATFRAAHPIWAGCQRAPHMLATMIHSSAVFYCLFKFLSSAYLRHQHWALILVW
jgi:hypothetical protein